MSVRLTPNAIKAINDGDVNAKPLVQVLEINQIGSGQERYRLLISDSVCSQHAMLATQLNDRVKRGHVLKGSVIQLIDYISSNLHNRKVIVVLNFETIIAQCDVVGNPNSGPGVSSPQTENKSNGGNREQTYQPVVQQSYKPPPSYKNHGAISKNEAPARIIPIAALNPYQGRWAIKARVTAKGELRRYNNARGDGKVFSFDLLDSDGSQIRATCFNSVADRFYDAVEMGKVYVISKGALKPAQKNFNHLKNEWEIFLESSSTVSLCEDEDASIPQQQFSFVSINDIQMVDTNSIVDVVGIVTLVNPSVPILRKDGSETQRRVINLTDASRRVVELTLWGDFCNKEGHMLEEMVGSGSFPVLAVKAAKVSDFSGKSLGTISSTQLITNPDIGEARQLQEWYARHGRDEPAVSISSEVMPSASKNEIRKTVSDVRDEELGRSGKPDWVTITATLSFIKADSFCYPACPLMIGERKCSKKVTKVNGFRWKCERCSEEFEECEYRYVLQVQVQDHSGMMWATAFQEAGEELMGCTAEELKNDAELSVFRGKVFGKYNFRMRIKEESNGVKATIIKVEEVRYSSHSRYLLGFI